MRSILLVANPFATGVTAERLRAVERELARVGEVTTELTRAPEARDRALPRGAAGRTRSSSSPATASTTRR